MEEEALLRLDGSSELTLVPCNGVCTGMTALRNPKEAVLVRPCCFVLRKGMGFRRQGSAVIALSGKRPCVLARRRSLCVEVKVLCFCQAVTGQTDMQEWGMRSKGQGLVDVTTGPRHLTSQTCLHAHPVQE